ncbi:S-adenosyl-L-methionine-dependent methyltransferase [Lentinula edodes]|uniref:S-adenosyl-L-methionine-dependent methyltransferase n=1 Tax=Lentinula edodes TaxID=5353 RepID=UPI001E8D1F2A|nr:S-adenosyl-L-methionine-dependent methyltransferase [Lentinula edodes]KAH7876413.1 S-adenosyl-L-methionine-dependent methyltransferase [Lentinula edodes]
MGIITVRSLARARLWVAQTRGYAAVSASGPTPSLTMHTLGPFQVFDRETKRIQKDRAASKDGGESSRTVDYVRDEIADRMMERLEDIKRKFSTIVDLGSGSGHFSKLLDPDKTQKCIMIDSSHETLHRDPDSEFEVEVERVHANEENLLQIISPNSQEAIVSCLSLHWVNDLPGVLIQIKEALQPDGLFLGAMFGGETLFELRTALQLAEVDREGGISPHISPMTDTRDVSNLLGRAGFTLLTVDIDEVKVAYPSMWELMDDLRDMGESNAVIGRRHIVHRDTLAAASAIYKELHGNGDGTVPATFQVIFMIGWKPAPTQPRPLERGSGKTNLKDVL